MNDFVIRVLQGALIIFAVVHVIAGAIEIYEKEYGRAVVSIALAILFAGVAYMGMGSLK